MLSLFVEVQGQNSSQQSPRFGDEEETALLDEALTLIDACNDLGSDSWSNADKTEPTKRVAAGVFSQSQSAILPNNQRPVRRPESNPTAFQRRQKSQLVSLRHEAAILETRVQKLKQRNDRLWDRNLELAAGMEVVHPGDEMHSKQQSDNSAWCMLAAKEYRHRLAAEKLNRKLKTDMVHHIKVNRDIHGILQNRPANYGMDVVSREECQDNCPLE